MPRFNVKAPDGSVIPVDAPEGATEQQAIEFAAKTWKPTAPVDDKPEYSMLHNIGGGLIKGASDIGATLLWPVDKALNAAGITDMTNAQRREALGQFFKEHANPDSIAFKGGALTSQIAGTAGAPNAIAKGVAAIPQIARFAPAIASGGFDLGSAATNSAIANGVTRAAAGAIGGATQAGMVDPHSVGSGAVIGAATPGAVQIAGMAGKGIREGLESGADRLMQSALKPSKKMQESGAAANAIRTMLAEGLNATKGGVEKMKSGISELNDQIAAAIAGSGATIDKANVVAALNGTKAKFANQVNPVNDLAAIDSAASEFASHPSFANQNAIPVELAQKLKQGTYQVLNGKYGEVGSASTEAQKALARGLKEGIVNAVPEVGALNARESNLLDALKVTRRRVLQESNNNIMGIAGLSPHPGALAAMMLDKNALVKSLLARALNKGAQANPVPQALIDATRKYGVLGAPALTAPLLQQPQ